MKTITKERFFKFLFERNQFLEKKAEDKLHSLFDSYEALQAENEALKQELKNSRARNGMKTTKLMNAQTKLSEYENRSCESCKYWKQENNSQIKNNNGMCMSYADNDEYYSIGITSKDFCCNKYEPKDK